MADFLKSQLDVQHDNTSFQLLYYFPESYYNLTFQGVKKYNCSPSLPIVSCSDSGCHYYCIRTKTR